MKTALPASSAAMNSDIRQAERQQGHGLAMMVFAMLVLPSIDVIAKLLGRGGADNALARLLDLGPALPPLEIASARFVVQMAILAPLVLLLAGPKALMPRRLTLTALRGALIAATTLLFFTGLQYLPVAECISIFFVEPLFLTVLSALVLGEPIGWRRLLAVALGLGGSLLIVQPNFDAVGWPALLPLGAAFSFAFYLLLTKILASTENALTLHLWAGISGSALLLSAMALGGAAGMAELTPVAPGETQLWLLGALGLVATFGHFLIVLAFRRAPASLLAPFQYLEIVSATLLGWLVFHEFPGPEAWTGVAIIVGSGVFVLWREQRRKAEASTAGPGDRS